MPLRTTLYVLLLLTGMLFAAEPPKSPVVIVKHDATSEELPLDPKNPPAQMQKLAPGHQAFTHSEFSLGWIVRDLVQSQSTANGKTTAVITIVGVDLTVDMKTTIWFPRNPPKKLRDHEAGHKKIGEMFYETADAEAKKAGESWIGKTSTGTGTTLDEARQSARQQVGDALTKAYLAVMSDENQKVHDQYDQITRHGMDTRVKEEDAIRQAFEKQKKPTTKPGKR